MPDVITSDGSIRQDDWVVVPRPADGESLDVPEQPALIPADLWLAGKEHFEDRDDIGVWLDSHDEPEILAGVVNELPVIAVNFPKFSDGRGYSIARLLRERLSYRNELRAVGDVLLDQLQFMKRCGFDTYVLRADKDINKAARCLNFFTQGYQAATDTDEPLFRRRAS
ncbi:MULTISPECIES: DUF934 domain-containing protein [Marinobacter]|jgi:uncharacterized protein (DUF934 family)|uniref:Oxidoreductase n=1 Tax=Marinobacter salarius TaxID=1420917 RepID=W5YQ59_9GAMM|nr:MULTISPECIES: DUF934 domain-containing protein [Marinobacter]AHI31256.1 hypothetical protein AU15_07690 [Marinobacter salarius]ARM84164.1 oxidoreductase [Marinobacter salarius]AZR42931.1 hypothetical protein MTMN5_03496 [Marinobacter salarius]KXJ48029.1 MAG: oxidoreductase [Marinobacter sp. Hex_13]MAB53667.1 DUF934 domain-containing protein [Marinobacter sp.]|tara:strand:+ start:6856 stop:7359 length:504 start_codon:yes stop_codon:yes gene_type:complete